MKKGIKWEDIQEFHDKEYREEPFYLADLCIMYKNSDDLIFFEIELRDKQGKQYGTILIDSIKSYKAISSALALSPDYFSVPVTLGTKP